MLDNNYVIIVNTDMWNGVVIENYEKATFLRRGSAIHDNRCVGISKLSKIMHKHTK